MAPDITYCLCLNVYKANSKTADITKFHFYQDNDPQDTLKVRVWFRVRDKVSVRLRVLIGII